MIRAGAILSLCLGVLAAATIVSDARAQSAQPEIVVAQNEGRQVPRFFRFLFGNNRPAPAPPPQLELFPGFEIGPPTPRRERRARPAAPAPREVAAVEKAPDAKRAMVIGDFMAGALAKGLAEAYAENANVVVIDASSGSSGLVRSDYYDWPAKVAELIEAQKPDAILVLIGGNDRQAIRTETGSQALGTDGWRAAYTARVASLADSLKAAGKPIFWGGLVPVSSSAMSRDYSAFNGIVREQLEAKGLRFVDMWNGFADEEGKYVSVGPDVRGQSVQLRASDGLNFTRAGQRKLAYFVEQELNDIFGGKASLLASADPGALNAATGAALGPELGPMVPLESLGLVGGDTLSGAASGDARGSVAESISARLADTAAPSAPVGRADSYVWPPRPAAAPAAAPVPALGVGAR